MRAMRVLLVGLTLAACSSNRVTVRDQAITGCRQAGYLGAHEDAGLWYCWKGPPLSLPQPAPVQ